MTEVTETDGGNGSADDGPTIYEEVRRERIETDRDDARS